VEVCEYSGGKDVAEKIEEANIILTKNLLPFDNQNNRENPSGLRIGFQDFTRRGFKESGVKNLCDLMLNVIQDKRKPSKVKGDVVALRREFEIIKYVFHNVDEAVKYAKTQRGIRCKNLK
jgi:glycine hydroxymethyltransferase